MRILILPALLAVLALAYQGSASNYEPGSRALAASQSPAQSAQAMGSFKFAAAGDHTAGSRTAASLGLLDQSGASFYLALGDLDYDSTPTDEAWCDYIKQRLPTLGPNFPFELVTGNHEHQGGSNGYIMNHAACLPDRLNSTGVYGAQYYFDYPASAPLIRVIMIAPSLMVENVQYNYTPGSAPYNWLASAIDNARSGGIPWIAVGMHKVCITTGDKSCETGTALLNLLVDKRVDLVLQGHDHNYQRSKQIVLRPGTCSAIASNAADADCIADDGADNAYAKGAGSVFVISGTFGQCCYGVSATDPDAPYFAQINGNSNGYTEFMVSSTRIDAQFVPSVGTFTDSFSIVGGNDSDGDGFTDGIEAYAGTNSSDNCGTPATLGPPSPAWTADLHTGSISTNRVNISDLASFVAPVRRINSFVGGTNYSPRWDVNADGTINTQDIAIVSILRPAMFAGARAFNGPACTP
jgi:hypothetical protein